MSIQGHVHFFTTDQSISPARAIVELARLAQVTEASELLRTDRAENGWADFCRLTGRPVDPAWRPTGTRRAGEEVESFKWERIADSVPVGELPHLYVEGRCVEGFLGPEWWRELEAGIRGGIPESVHGGFVPASIGFKAGWHDLFENMAVDHGHFVARARFSVTMFGHGCPNDWAGFERQFLALPVIVTLRANVERILGRTETCILFS